MRHNLNIRVSDKPRNGGVVACRTVSIREKLFTLLLGPKQKVMVVVPGNSVESIAITEVPMGGGIHEYYYDAAAIAEPVAETTVRRMKGARSTATKHGSIIPGQQNIQKINLPRAAGTYTDADIPQLRNKRDVWQINTVRTGAGILPLSRQSWRKPVCWQAARPEAWCWIPSSAPALRRQWQSSLDGTTSASS